MDLLTRAVEVLKKDGPLALVKRSIGLLYLKFVREHTAESGEYFKNNQVNTGKKYIFDDIFLSHYDEDRNPDLEGGIVSCHEKITKTGDEVVIIGGGEGITTVRAAMITGERGKVTIYEGGKESIDRLNDIIRMNNVEDRCEPHHAVVGVERNVYGGNSASAESVSSDKIPDCDVLELDCEGSEIDILTDISIHPRAVILELHPWNFQEDPHELLDILVEKGYKIEHTFGHDGTPLTQEEFETLLSNSNSQGERYVESGGRWPVVVGAVLDDG